MSKLLLGIFLAGCGWTDGRKKEISLLWLILGAATGGICLFMKSVSLEDAGGIFVGLFLLAAAFLSKGQVGLGDGLAFLVCGLFLDFWENSMLLLGGLTLLLLKSLADWLRTDKNNRRKGGEQPLFPFVFAAYIGGLFWIQKS